MNSHSSTSQFNTCPYAYKLSKVDGLKRQTFGAESNDKVWASAMHRGLEALHSGQTLKIAQDWFEQAYPADLDDQETVWNREGGFRTLEAYQTKYESTLSQWETLGTELDNREEGDDESEGHLIIDWVARHKFSGSIYFWDHKFKRKLYQDTGKQYELDSQLSRYAAYIKRKYGQCAGAVVNLICPGFRQRAYKGEPAGWHFKFDQQVFNRSQDQIEQWQRDQADWEWFIERCRIEDRWPKHRGWQCPRCDFYDVCNAEKEGGSSEEIREALYRPGLDEMNVIVEDE